MAAMRNQMDEVQDDRELVQIKIDRLSTENENDTPADRAEKVVMIRKHQRQLAALDRSLETLQRTFVETEEEARFLARAFRMLEQEESIKPFDDIEAQTEYWNAKYSQKLDLLMLLNKPLDTTFIHDILLLDDKMPVKKKVISLLEMVQQQALASITKKEEPPCQIESRP